MPSGCALQSFRSCFAKRISVSIPHAENGIGSERKAPIQSILRCILCVFVSSRHQIKQKTLHLHEGFFKRKATNRGFSRTRHTYNKKACLFRQASLKKGDDILSHITAVPSAQAGLTTLFGMGRGEPRRNNHLKFLRQ